MNNENRTTLSETAATQGVKFGTMRYVLGISLVLATVAGMVIWNLFAS